MATGQFHNTPVTKFIILATAGASVLSGVLSSAPRLLTILDLLERPARAGRLLLLPWTYYTTGELLFGTILLYLFRVFERHWGSSKFAAYAFLSSVSSLLVHLGLFIVFKPLPFAALRPGPYGVVFSLLWRYFVEIPPISKFSLFGVALTDKLLVYALALQLLLLGPPSTVTAGLSGLLGGILASSHLLRLGTLRFPEWLELAAHRHLRPLLQAAGRPYTVTPVLNANLAALHAQAQEGRPSSLLGGAGPGPFVFSALHAARQELQRPPNAADHATSSGGTGASGAAPPSRAPIVSEEDVGRLEELGFGRDEAKAALIANSNNVELAAAWLLGS